MEEKNYPKLTIHNLGPIKDCEMVVKDFTVFIGPQSQGKSTIAKAVYFFRSVKEEIIDLMLRGWPAKIKALDNAWWRAALNQQLADKFGRYFAYSFYAQRHTFLRYEYTEKIWMELIFVPDDDVPFEIPEFTFSDGLSDYLKLLDKRNPMASEALSPAMKNYHETRLNQLFQDDSALVYIPAGRHLTTLLNSQLNYIFTSMDDAQRLSIDPLTIGYVERILRLKPLFKNGWDGLTVTLRQVMKKNIRQVLQDMKAKSKKVLGGEYSCSDYGEYIVVDGASIDLNHASSGQQEAVWPLNLMCYHLLEEKKTFLIFEEPESNLYPDSQRTVAELLALFHNAGNQVMVTTHSPYLLATFNYLLMGGQCETAGMSDSLRQTLKERYQLTPDFWLSPAHTDAYFVSGGSIQNAVTNVDGVDMIKNELIDAVSEDMNAVSDLFLDKLYHWSDGDK